MSKLTTMSNQERWSKEAKKVTSLTSFNKKAKITIFPFLGIILTILVLVLYFFFVKAFTFDLSGAKIIIAAILVGFSLSAAITGLVSSVLARRVNEELLGKPPNAEDYPKAKRLLMELDDAKGEMKQYFLISAVLLVLNAVKDMIGLFTG